MPIYDVSINAVSLFGFILVLGIVVDDAVVVAESIHLQNEKGIYGTTAALNGVYEVYKPILFAPKHDSRNNLKPGTKSKKSSPELITGKRFGTACSHKWL